MMARMHASAVAVAGRGLLILGRSGSGKSSLALELMCRGATLISDDQVELYRQNTTLMARAPHVLSGLIEARGVGLLRADAAPAAIVAVADLDHVEAQRLPPRRETEILGLTLPVFQKVESAAWPSALAQYLLSGRSAPE